MPNHKVAATTCAAGPPAAPPASAVVTGAVPKTRVKRPRHDGDGLLKPPARLRNRSAIAARPSPSVVWPGPHELPTTRRTHAPAGVIASSSARPAHAPESAGFVPRSVTGSGSVVIQLSSISFGHATRCAGNAGHACWYGGRPRTGVHRDGEIRGLRFAVLRLAARSISPMTIPPRPPTPGEEG